MEDVDDGRIEGVREIWRSPGFPDYPWTVTPTLEAVSVDAVRQAFVRLDEQGRTDILQQQNVDKYVEATHEAFTTLDEAVEMAGITKEKEE